MGILPWRRTIYSLGLIRRSAIAACGAFALLGAVACQYALAQPGLPIRNIQVDVTPLRATVGEPTASWVQESLPDQLAKALASRMSPKGSTLVVRIELSHSGSEQGQPRLGQHWRRRDHRGRAAAGAGDLKILGFGDRPDDVRGIQSPARDATRANARLLAGQRPLNPLAVASKALPTADPPRGSSSRTSQIVCSGRALSPRRSQTCSRSRALLCESP